MFTVKQVALGESHCIFLLGDGSLWGVGSNEYGQLGFSVEYKSHDTNIEEIRQISMEGFDIQKRDADYTPSQTIV